MTMKFKNADGTFSILSKVIGMLSGLIVTVIAVGGAAFEIDERHAHTIEVAGQFKSIDDSRNMDNLQNALALTQIRLDILEDRLFREQQKEIPSQEYLQKLKSDIRKLNKQFDQINQELIDQQ